MLSTHVKEAEKKRHELQHQFAIANQKIERAAHKFSDALLTDVNEDVFKAYQAERQIETELRNIDRLMSANATQTDQWSSLIDRLSTELKELGDITNWVNSLENVAIEIHDITQKLTNQLNAS